LPTIWKQFRPRGAPPEPLRVCGTTNFTVSSSPATSSGEYGQWKAVVVDDSLRADYLHSLALVRELDFDVLVPWGTAEGYPSIDLVSSESVNRRRIDAIIDRGEAGHNS
jgi:hypothetical protein